MSKKETKSDKNGHPGWHDGSCCCNCKHQKKLMCHPWNKGFGEGSISKQCGWVCDVMYEDESNKGEYIFYSFEHGMCELHTKIEAK